MKTHNQLYHRSVSLPLQMALNDMGCIPATRNYDLFLPDHYQAITTQLENLGDVPPHLQIATIPGIEALLPPNAPWAHLNQLMGRSEAEAYTLPSYLLSDESEWQRLSRDFEAGFFYLLQANVQGGSGLRLATTFSDIECARSDGYLMAQRLHLESLLLHEHRVSIRLYILVVSRGRKIQAFSYRDGLCLYSESPNAPETPSIASLITCSTPPENLYHDLPMGLHELGSHPDSKDIDWGSFLQKTSFVMAKTLQACSRSLGTLAKLERNTCFDLLEVDILPSYSCSGGLTPLILGLQIAQNMTFSHELELDLKYEIYHDLFQVVASKELIPPSTNGFTPLFIPSN